jgi:hypothetical protein
MTNRRWRYHRADDFFDRPDRIVFSWSIRPGKRIAVRIHGR